VVPLDWRARPAEKTRVANELALTIVVTTPGTEFSAARTVSADDAVWHREAGNGAIPSSHRRQDWNAPAMVLATSGTTGLPKFTLATNLQFYLQQAAYQEIVPPGRHRYLSLLPLHFAAGMKLWLAHLLRGDTVVLYPPLFGPAEYVDIVARHDITAGFVVPTTVRQLLALSGPGQPLLPGLALLICGGAPLFAEEKRAAASKLTPRFHVMYGCAATGPISVLRPHDLAERAASTGRPVSLIDVEVVDADDRACAPGAIGRLRVRGPGLSSPLPTRSAGTDDFRDGWHYPGELAALDAHGYIFLEGRSSEVIFRGGAKIVPMEVEMVLQEHANVAEAAVVGIASADNQQDAVAFVVARGPLAPGELIAHCRSRLTAYKVPRAVHIIADLPRTSSGKVDKAALAKGVHVQAATPDDRSARPHAGG
jgi:acyl-coenzyme A synthetase/AMP-(fatty) acid ligase